MLSQMTDLVDITILSKQLACHLDLKKKKSILRLFQDMDEIREEKKSLEEELRKVKE